MLFTIQFHSFGLLLSEYVIFKAVRSIIQANYGCFGLGRSFLTICCFFMPVVNFFTDAFVCVLCSVMQGLGGNNEYPCVDVRAQ